MDNRLIARVQPLGLVNPLLGPIGVAGQTVQVRECHEGGDAAAPLLGLAIGLQLRNRRLRLFESGQDPCS